MDILGNMRKFADPKISLEIEMIYESKNVVLKLPSEFFFNVIVLDCMGEKSFIYSMI